MAGVDRLLVPGLRPSVERIDIDDMNAAAPHLDQFGSFECLECALYDFTHRTDHGGHLLLRVCVLETRGLLHQRAGSPSTVDEPSSHPPYDWTQRKVINDLFVRAKPRGKESNHIDGYLGIGPQEVEQLCPQPDGDLGVRRP